MLTYNDRVCTSELYSEMCKCIGKQHNTANMNSCEVFQKINIGIEYNFS